MLDTMPIGIVGILAYNQIINETTGMDIFRLHFTKQAIETSRCQGRNPG